jgi:hypothetical protein
MKVSDPTEASVGKLRRLYRSTSMIVRNTEPAGGWLAIQPRRLFSPKPRGDNV